MGNISRSPVTCQSVLKVMCCLTVRVPEENRLFISGIA